MFGILSINKPAGWTSRDVVNRVQRLVRPAKVGHAGTLDPLATGVLVVCVGPATRLLSYVQQLPKTYDATFLLGRSSPSDDTETEVSELANPVQPTQAEIEAAFPRFLGKIQQRPPTYSAVKVNGQRAYKLARQGADVELKSREVEIYELGVVSYKYPELCMTMRCGSGTYVRSLGRDVATTLGTAAVMSKLSRTAIGDFSIGEAVDLESLDLAAIQASLLPPLTAVKHLPQLRLNDSQIAELRHGRCVSAAELDVPNGLSREAVLVALNADAELVALMSEKRPGELGPLCNFSQSS